MRHFAIQRAGELHLVVGVDVRVVLSARHRHVRQSLVHELLAGTVGLHMHQDATRGLSLAAVAAYTGTTTREGPITDGKLIVTR